MSRAAGLAERPVENTFVLLRAKTKRIHSHKIVFFCGLYKFAASNRPFCTNFGRPGVRDVHQRQSGKRRLSGAIRKKAKSAQAV